MAEFTIDCDFPGGNIVVDSIQGDRVTLRVDMRDSDWKWFYWAFRVRGAAGRTIEFSFPSKWELGVRGPGVSLDQGLAWKWHPGESRKAASFSYSFPADASEVWFSVGMPYTERHLRAWLAKHSGHPHLAIEALVKSRKGRDVEMLRLGRLDGQASRKILLTSRHHACEMMTNYALEGVMASVLADDDAGRWYWDNTEILVIPFVDKDGVEDGDQGKNRKPFDHGVDYSDKNLYVETAALREVVPAWAGDRLRLALELHCPGLREELNEHLHFFGVMEGDQPGRLNEFTGIFDRIKTCPFPHDPATNMPVDIREFKEPNARGEVPFSQWAAGLVRNGLVGGFELPYANAGGVEVNAESARALGRDLARAMSGFFELR